MGVIQKLIFKGGMNSDSSPEDMQPGEARARINCRVLSSDNDEDGALETPLGNTLTAYTLPSGGTYKVIGAKEYLKTGKAYYFVHCTIPAQNLILQYDMYLNTITKVLQDAATAPYYLNFNEDYLITGINVVELDSENHLLYWTDNYNQPKKINIEKAILHAAGDYINGYPSPFEAAWTYRIKKPPLTPPTYTWSTTAGQDINYLFKKLFQFKVQFVYDDREISAWSPISKYAWPATTHDNDTGEDILTQSNTITIAVPTGSGIVKKIRIAGKELAAEDFSLIAELDKTDLSIGNDATYNFKFYNNGNYVTLEVNESIKLFDSVPLLSQAQELIAGNRLTDGNITEGFNPVNIDLRLPLSFAPGSFPVNPWYPNKSYLKPGGAYKHGIVYYEGYGNRSGTSNIVSGKTSELKHDRYGTTLYVPFLTETAYTGNAMDVIPIVNAEIYNPPPSWATHYQIVRSKNETMGRYIQFSAQNVVYLDGNGNITPPASAAYIKVFIGNIIGRYKDENPNSKLVYDFIPQDRIRFIANRDWAVLTPSTGSLAPLGGNSLSYSSAIIASTSLLDSFFAFNDNEITSFDSGAQTITLKCNTGFVPDDLLPGVLFEIYQPAENAINDNEILYECGECRQIITDPISGSLVHDGTTPQKLNIFLSASQVGAFITVTILAGHGYTIGAKVKVSAADGSWSSYGVVSGTTGTTITVNTTGFTIVGTFASAIGIITRAAQFTLSGGDNFRKYQDMPALLPSVTRLYSYVDAMNASNMFASEAWEIGRPNKVDPNFRQVVRPSTIYYSESFIPETNINGLSSVFDTNFETYEDKYGGIYKLYAEDLRLIVFQQLKVGQLPVNQIIYNDLSLQNTVGASNVVLSPQMVYYLGEFGIGKNPESFAVYGKVKYFVDVLRGAILRLSQDGITQISKVAKFHNFTTDLCKSIVATKNTNFHVYGVYDVKFGEYIVAFEEIKSLTPMPGYTFAFNEEANVFSTFYSFKPDYMLGINVGIVTFKSGALYIHNTNSTYNNFYGSQAYTEAQVMVNLDPSKKKVLQAIAMETDTPWDLVTITTPQGQSTHLIEANFEDHEDYQYSEIKMDENTPNVTNPIVEGNPMRSQTALVAMRFTKPIYNKLYAVNIMLIPSQRSNS
jgi:hypothetical protein